MSSKRKPTSLTYADKLKAIQAVKNGFKRKEVAARFGIHESTLSIMIKKEAEILKKRESGKSLRCKRLKTAEFPNLEQCLFAWFKQCRNKNISVSGSILKEKAEEFANSLNIKKFRASNGWFENFKKRHDLAFKMDTYIRTFVHRDVEETAVEEITIKEEFVEEEFQQCRLCLSTGRKMWPIGDYEVLYRKLLLDVDYGNPSESMSQLLACWECNGMLRKIQHFQDRVRRAKVAFETNQNHHIESLSTLTQTLTSDAISNLPNANINIKEEIVEMEFELEQTEIESTDPLNIEEEQSKRAKEIQRKGIQKKKVKQDIVMDCDNIFGKVKIEMEELEKILEDRRVKDSYKAMKYKCDFCVLGFTDEGRLLEHHTTFHHEDVGSLQCGICARRYSEERHLAAHYRNHFVKFVCKLCSFECYTKSGRKMHFKRHKQDTIDSTSRQAEKSQAMPGRST